jgi:hypothetical protein
VYGNANAKTVGDVTVRVNSVAGFNAVAVHLLADATLTAAIGGTPHRDVENESYATTLKCHDQNGELYNVMFGRENVRLNSYSDFEDLRSSRVSSLRHETSRNPEPG